METENLENQEKEEVHIVETALKDIAYIVCNRSKPLTRADIYNTMEQYEIEENDEREFKSLTRELQVALLREGKPDINRRKEIIKKLLGQEEEENEVEDNEIDVKTQEKTNTNLKQALLEVFQIMKNPDEQLTNLKIEDISEKYCIEYKNFKQQIKDFNKIANEANIQHSEKVVNEFLGIESDETENEANAEEEAKNKENALNDLKEIYLNAPNKLTKEEITKRGLTLDEVKTKMPEWREEKNKVFKDA